MTTAPDTDPRAGATFRLADAATGSAANASCGACPADGCEICRCVGVRARALVLAVSTLYRFDAGRTAPLADVLCGGIAVLTSGSLTVSRLFKDGRRSVVGFVIAGETLPPVAKGDAVTGIEIEALVDSVVRVANAAAVEAAFADAPDLLAAVWDVTRRHLAGKLQAAASLSRMSAAELLAAFLVDYMERTCGGVRDGAEAVLPMTRGDIADHLGLKPETVSRQFTRLRQAGLIALPKPDTVRIRLADALMDLTLRDTEAGPAAA